MSNTLILIIFVQSACVAFIIYQATQMERKIKSLKKELDKYPVVDNNAFVKFCLDFVRYCYVGNPPCWRGSNHLKEIITFAARACQLLKEANIPKSKIWKIEVKETKQTKTAGMVIRQLLQQRQSILHTVEDIVSQHLGIDEGQWYAVGDWDCDKSPFGLCTYHKINDRVKDHCIFCGLPYERK
jgi:hypothetical protein